MGELSKSHPTQTAQFAVALGLDHEPAFDWWVKDVLKKRERITAIIRKQQTRYLMRRHKFGINLPKTVEEAYALDAKKDSMLWADIQRNGKCQSGI